MQITKYAYLPMVLLFACLLSSCVSRTIIRSTPTGADLYINDEYYGQTPVDYGDKKVLLTSSTLRFVKEGYKEGTFIITKDGTVKVGPTLCGCATLPMMLPIGWLWALGYKKLYKFELTPSAE